MSLGFKGIRRIRIKDKSKLNLKDNFNFVL